MSWFRIENRLLTGDVRCRCGALMFKACGPVCLEMKCRRCGQLWRFANLNSEREA